MAFNLKVYQVRHYPFNHPKVKELPKDDMLMKSKTATDDDDYLNDYVNDSVKEAIDQQVHNQFENARKKLDLL